jgi:uncharacterized protein YdaU (DUF1376 family)
MILAGTASRGDIGDYLVDTYDWDARTHGAFQLLTMRYRLVGPMPFDDKKLAEICRVTKAVWMRRIWPAIQAFFTPGDDGLIHHEELDRLPRAAESKRSAAGRVAANARWEAIHKARQLTLPTDAIASESHMRSHANRMPIASENSAISTAGASGSHPSPARADAPTPLSSSSLNPVESETQEAPRGESESRASDAPPMRSDAPGYANRTRSQPAKPAPAPISPDWQPSPADQLEAIKRGLDVAETVAKFRDHYLATGQALADWGAKFRNWCRDEAKRAQPQQRGMLMPIGGRRTALDAQTERQAGIDEMMDTVRAARREREERERGAA